MTKAVKSPLIKESSHPYLKSFLMSGILAAIIFIPFIIIGKGIFWYMGDYNAQQIPFYVHCHEMIRNGTGMWDFSTELGNNVFSSYTYYTLCSPFFWLMIPFPTSWVPYLMGPMYILKFACAGLTSFAYIRYFTKTDKSALIGSLLYTFSGWSVFNIFYNQFHESFIVFPLLLLSLEKLVKEKKKGIFGLMVAISAITNYYFFVGMVVFVVIYFLIKTISRSWDMNFKIFLRIFAEALFGCLVALFVLVPSAITVFGMSRTSEPLINGWQFWLYTDTRVYFYIIQSLFFPAEIPAIQSFCYCQGIAWQSLSLYLPLFGIIGVLTFISKNKKDWKSRLLIISFIMAMIPGLNALFTMLQPIYYARWFMMPLLIMSMVSAVAMEEYEVSEFIPSYKKVSIITLVIILITALTPIYEDGKWKIGIWNRDMATSVFLFIMFSFIAVYQLLVLFNDGRKETFIYKNKKIFMSLCSIILIVTILTLGIGRTTSNKGESVKTGINFETLTEDMNLENGARLSVFSSNYNLSTTTGVNSIDFFHSIAPEGTIKTYKTLLDYDRGVTSPQTTNNPYFKTITSVKYFISDKDYDDEYVTNMSDGDDFIENFDALKEKYGYALMPNYSEFNLKDEKYKIYKNDCYLSMGIAYDYYITETEYNKLNSQQQGKAMINALVIADEYEDEVKNTLANYSYIASTSKVYSDEEYLSDCQQKLTCNEFKEGKNSFTASIKSNTERYVMFSVSSDNDGWTAYVNGKETDILKVDGGLMAVKVGKGENNIEFKYEVPGLKIGLVGSSVGVVGLIVLFVLPFKKKSKI